MFILKGSILLLMKTSRAAGSCLLGPLPTIPMKAKLPVTENCFSMFKNHFTLKNNFSTSLSAKCHNASVSW